MKRLPSRNASRRHDDRRRRHVGAHARPVRPARYPGNRQRSKRSLAPLRVPVRRTAADVAGNGAPIMVYGVREQKTAFEPVRHSLPTRKEAG